METSVFLYFYVWVLGKYSFQEEKALATWPLAEQPGELSAFCKQAISFALGSLWLCTAENVGTWLHSVKWGKEKVLYPTCICQLSSLDTFLSFLSVPCYTISNDEKLFY